MCTRGKVVQARLIWTGNGFEGPLQIRCDCQGTITEIGKDVAKDDEEVVDLGSKVRGAMYFVRFLSMKNYCLF